MLAIVNSELRQQSWARDNPDATTWPCFKAKQWSWFLNYFYSRCGYTSFRQVCIKKVSFFSCHRGSITLSLCRCHDAKICLVPSSVKQFLSIVVKSKTYKGRSYLLHTCPSLSGHADAGPPACPPPPFSYSREGRQLSISSDEGGGGVTKIMQGRAPRSFAFRTFCSFPF